MSDKVKDIADLLPEGMSQELISEIATVMQDIISERLDEEMDVLATKVHGFLRHQMDTIQEAALDELSESHEIYRDAQALKNIKSILSFEIEREDIDPIVSQVNEDINKVHDNNDILIQELSESIKDNQRLERVITNLEDKMTSLNAGYDQLQGDNNSLREELDSDFESTEKAIIIRENVDNNVKDVNSIIENSNPFLTDEVMAFMPHNNN
tara:strand:- start:509 stop:1141 length:633 start_codon:yes stop_codon:yes gene_type:complete